MSLKLPEFSNLQKPSEFFLLLPKLGVKSPSLDICLGEHADYDGQCQLESVLTGMGRIRWKKTLEQTLPFRASVSSLVLLLTLHTAVSQFYVANQFKSEST